MGKAAYDRGSQALSRQIDDEMQARDSAPVTMRSFKRLEGALAITEQRNAELTAQVAALREESATAELRAEQAHEVAAKLEDTLNEANRQLKRLRGFWRAARSRADMMERRWRWVSSIVRCHVSPAMVDEHRGEPVTRDVGKGDRRLAS